MKISFLKEIIEKKKKKENTDGENAGGHYVNFIRFVWM